MALCHLIAALKCERGKIWNSGGWLGVQASLLYNVYYQRGGSPHPKGDGDETTAQRGCWWGQRPA